MNVREKLMELLCEATILYDKRKDEKGINPFEVFADYLIAHDVTVQEHGYWETVVEVRDNTVCGNGAKIEYKRCSCCKNPAKFFEDDFCGNCGAKMKGDKNGLD